MDPIANLNEQLKLAKLLAAMEEDYVNESTVIFDACRLAELVLALDDWRKRGGFDPYK